MPVWLSSKENPSKEVLVYALVDSMSDTTYITIDAMNKIKPNCKTAIIDITTMTSERKQVDSHIVHELTIRAYRDSKRYDLPPSYSHLKLPIDREQIPTKDKLQKWPHLVEVANDLPSDHHNIPVGLLIGNNFMNAFRPKHVINTQVENEPFAIKTAIGWKVMG